ncbi:hypothetical protein MKX07_000405 [Trichoderma sp. CBMAI-0711]|nr:hypothetical protein MKX07_000405 [Trichoderma sp. CBMAI-0711]
MAGRKMFGNKKDNVTIIYTPWSNLKKDGSMDVGQVSFHDPRKASSLLQTSYPHPDFARCLPPRGIVLYWLTQECAANQVKRVLVPHRENPIVNRLNKTKVERKPDLKAERDDMLKELRKKEQAAQLIKVRDEIHHIVRLAVQMGRLFVWLRSTSYCPFPISFKIGFCQTCFFLMLHQTRASNSPCLVSV